MPMPVDTPGEDYQAWSTTASANGDIDPQVYWLEGQTRKSVNNSSRSELAAHAKNRNLQNGSIVTAGSANAQTFVSGVGYTSASGVPTELRVLLKIGPGLSNTGSATLDMDAIGAVIIKNQAGNNLAAGTLIAGTYCEFLYDGTNWRLLNEPIGGQVLLGSATANISAAVDFTIGIDSTYDVYIFTFANVRPSVNGAAFIAVCSNNAGVGWLTTPGQYYEGLFTNIVSSGALASTGYTTQGGAILAGGITNGPGAVLGGELHWYAPWRGAQVPFMWQCGYNTGSDVYFNRGGCVCTVPNLNAMRFGMTTGNIESGDFAVYGVKK